jgi:hypothetical protein
MFKLTTNIPKQIERELFECDRQLLEAEGVLERATANRDMLMKRRSRLAARLGEGAMRVTGLGYEDA